MKHYKLVVFFLLLFMVTITPSNYAQETENIEIDFFYSIGCPACAQMKPFLEELDSNYDFVVLNSYEISSEQNSNKFLQKLNDYNVPNERRGYIPSIFVKDQFFIGYSNKITTDIKNTVVNGEKQLAEEDEIITTKILGIWNKTISLNNHSLFITTFLLGFFDSLNVCSITVLIFLIVYLLAIGSFKKAFKIGITYTIIIYLFYFLFMLLLSSVIGMFILTYGYYIRLVVFIISIFIGLLLIKDFFFYGKGITIGVPKSVKPLLEKHIKKATIISAISFALLASIVELPCTAVFPLIYSTILAENMIVGIQRILWIALYNLIYIIPLLLVVFGTYFSWIKIEEIDKKIQKYKKWLKLIAGVLLLLIALYFGYPIIF
jgi:thiol-disulfide isomerase/thioredoxin